MAERPLARVVKLIDPYTLVINKGSRDGVTDIMQFLVFAYGEELIDPETEEHLGKLEIVKGRGRVKHLQEGMTTIESADTRKVPPTFTLSNFPAEPTVRVVAFDDPKVGDFVRIR